MSTQLALEKRVIGRYGISPLAKNLLNKGDLAYLVDNLSSFRFHDEQQSRDPKSLDMGNCAREAAEKDLEFTGERMVPGKSDKATESQHLVRYEFVKGLAAGKRVLDAGCGSGYGSHMLSEVAESVVGIDVAAEAVAHASKHYQRQNLEYLNVDATSTGLPDASFDLITSFEVVEHIPDPQAYLKELKRLLKPGGTLVISTPNRLLTSPNSVKPLNPFHKYEWTREEFLAILSKHFDVKDLWGQQSFGRWQMRPDATSNDLFFVAFCGELPAELQQMKKSYRDKVSEALVSVVIPVYNKCEYTRKCIKTLVEDNHPKEIIVVDNGSTDDTAKLASEFSQVTVIRNEENRGFAAACNQGIEASAGDYVLLLNNDTLVPKCAIRRMVECGESDSVVGLVAPVSNAVKGRQMVQGCNRPEDYQKFADSLAEESRGKWAQMFFLAGLCLLIKRDVIEKVGLLDEAYGVGNYEDDDYCVRTYLAGFLNVAAMDAFIFHYGSQTFKASGVDYGALLEEKFEIFYSKWNHVELIRPRFVSDLVAYGIRHGEMEDFEVAVDYFRRALKINSTHRDAIKNMGICLANMGFLEDAILMLSKLMELYPDDAEGRSALAECRRLSGKVEAEQVGRNASCPCGSGKKYKKCCLHKEGAAQAA